VRISELSAVRFQYVITAQRPHPDATGRGFAVVASKVKSLASQTAKA
jgi:hypothetical protein